MKEDDYFCHLVYQAHRNGDDESDVDNNDDGDGDDFCLSPAPPSSLKAPL